MDEVEEVKLRLIEAAAQLPGVRAGVDAKAQAEQTKQVAELWYNYVMEARKRSPRRGRG